jgi:hypothetical protein
VESESGNDECGELDSEGSSFASVKRDEGTALEPAEQPPAAAHQDVQVPPQLIQTKAIDEIRGGRDIPDVLFDLMYPPWARRLSEQHWTPIRVARRAVELLEVDASVRVLDVGSGVGKFCMVGALTTLGQFTGVERRPHLVALAEQLTTRYGISRTSYLTAEMGQVDWNAFDAYYLYNPFGEVFVDASLRIDPSRRMSFECARRDIRRAKRMLAGAPIGARVVTYCGLGDTMPSCYERLVWEAVAFGDLSLWLKVR